MKGFLYLQNVLMFKAVTYMLKSCLITGIKQLRHDLYLKFLYVFEHRLEDPKKHS